MDWNGTSRSRTARNSTIIIRNTPENMETIEDTGFAFRRGDVLDLQRMLTVLLSDARLCSAAASRAQQRVRQNYQWDKVVGELGEIYAAMVRPEKNQPAIVCRRAA